MTFVWCGSTVINNINHNTLSDILSSITLPLSKSQSSFYITYHHHFYCCDPVYPSLKPQWPTHPQTRLYLDFLRQSSSQVCTSSCPVVAIMGLDLLQGPHPRHLLPLIWVSVCNTIQCKVHRIVSRLNINKSDYFL